ncbi:Hypothetical predicted protein [Olea europaea subsp. europaea]|uniref:Uncharacterized protein n=1 Tax=Olea europaea subsp. europaea TaxID=158383 RepID=A0A8S0PTJ0_OLEEU|nr:Hypothetical predicted protein [Olea europaea subsp. europaea]
MVHICSVLEFFFSDFWVALDFHSQGSDSVLCLLCGSVPVCLRFSVRLPQVQDQDFWSFLGLLGSSLFLLTCLFICFPSCWSVLFLGVLGVFLQLGLFVSVCFDRGYWFVIVAGFSCWSVWFSLLVPGSSSFHLQFSNSWMFSPVVLDVSMVYLLCKYWP